MHLAGGGNIGGVGPNNCLKWGMPKNGFNVTQSNGPQVGFTNLVVGPDGTVTGGTASFISNGNGDDLGGPVAGKVTGTIVGSHVDLKVRWTGQPVGGGHYVGEIGPDGSFTGTNTASNGVKATFKSERIWFKCSVDDLCQKYANDAIAAEQEFASLHCGAVGAGRWSDKIDDHINWCMGQPRGGVSPINAETDARTAELDKCRALDADCTKFGLEAAALTYQMKAKNCKEVADFMKPGAPSSGPDAMKKVCRLKPLEVDAFRQDLQNKLDACNARIAAGEPAGGPVDPGGGGDPAGGAGQAGGGANPGGAAGAGDPGAAQAQIPENQCVVVELDENAPPDEQQPGGGGVVGGVNGNPADQGNGLTVQKFAMKTPCVKGSNCDFKILVTGKSPAADGSVTIVDTPEKPETLDLPQGAALAVPPAAPWKCDSGLPLRCTHPGPVPTDGLVMTFSLKPGEKAAADTVRNCVATDLKAPANDAAPEPSCVNVPLQAFGPAALAGKLAISKNPVASKCSTTGGGCDFVVTVFNPDPAAEFNGPVSFSDHISAPDGSPFPNVSAQSPINAQADAGITGGTISCKKDGNDVNCSSGGASLKIPPGKKIVVPMSFTPGNGSVARAVKNCASLLGGEPKCATIPFADGSLLRAFKATAATTCAPECAFGIVIKNVGDSPTQNGRIIFNDVITGVDANAEIQVIDGDFTCQRVNGKFTCVSKADVVLKATEFSQRPDTHQE